MYADKKTKSQTTELIITFVSSTFRQMPKIVSCKGGRYKNGKTEQRIRDIDMKNDECKIVKPTDY